MRIAVDAMGTDNHPQADVEGAVMAARALNETMILVGLPALIEAELQKHNTMGLNIEIKAANDAISMLDKPAEVVRGKPNSSMHVGMRMIKEGEADAFVGAGNTGAMLAIAIKQIGRIRGVKRPAISAVGELVGNLVTLVDVGANTDTKLEWLVQFAIMGHIHASTVLNVKSPRVGLLSNGEEDTKGNQLIKDAHAPFADLPINFIGNIEPIDLLTNRVDVIVMDGFVGNILLKTYEAAIATVGKLLKENLTQDIRGRAGAALARPYLRKTIRALDPTQYGGAPLLGIDGVVIIAHGGSSALVMRNAIERARDAVQANLIEHIKTDLTQIQSQDNRSE